MKEHRSRPIAIRTGFLFFVVDALFKAAPRPPGLTHVVSVGLRAVCSNLTGLLSLAQRGAG